MINCKMCWRRIGTSLHQDLKIIQFQISNSTYLVCMINCKIISDFYSGKRMPRTNTCVVELEPSLVQVCKQNGEKEPIEFAISCLIEFQILSELFLMMSAVARVYKKYKDNKFNCLVNCFLLISSVKPETIYFLLSQ